MNPQRPVLRNPVIWQLVLAGYWLAMFVGTHLPPDLSALPPQASDKVPHFIGYAGLAVLLATAWQTAAGKLTRSHLWVVWMVVALYGALDEWSQDFVGRHANLGDWVADVLGALSGLIAFGWFQAWTVRRKS